MDMDVDIDIDIDMDIDMKIDRDYLDSVSRLRRGALEGENDFELFAGDVPGTHVPQRGVGVDLVGEDGGPEHL